MQPTPLPLLPPLLFLLLFGLFSPCKVKIGFLLKVVDIISNAKQVVHTMTYSVCWSIQVARLNPDKSIPLAVLKGAKGLAILTVAKAGVLVAYKLGTGLVISRRSDGSWSAPSAIVSVGLGWGAQVTTLLVLSTSVVYFSVVVLEHMCVI